MKYLILLLLFSKTFIAFSQNYGTLKGKVTDENINNEPVAFANVGIYKQPVDKNAELVLVDGTSTDENGDYYIPNIPAGIYIMEVSYVGLPNIRVENIQIKSNGIKPLDIKYPVGGVPPIVPNHMYKLPNGLWVGSRIVHR